MFTNRLFKSSKFWNAIIASILAIAAYYLTSSELLVGGIFGMFGLKQFTDGAEDFVKAQKGIRFNKESGKEEYIEPAKAANEVKED